jgi:CheY-like chemotaxis protein
MEDIGNILQGLAAIIWPLIVLIIILIFRNNLRSILESARARKFAIKIGDAELSMEEEAKQNRQIISDLMEQVFEIKKPGSIKSILWVDDHPKNNAMLMMMLAEKGIEVHTALSTEEALSKLDARKFDCIISDMGRTESGTYISTAGIVITRKIREKDRNIPIIIYSGSQTAQANEQEALDAGATEVTTTTTALIKRLWTWGI